MSDVVYRAEGSAEGLAFAAFGNWLFAIDPRTGRRVWYGHITASPSQVVVRIAVAGDRVVAAVGTEVSCWAYANGAEVWRAKSPIHAFALSVTAGVVLVGGNGEVTGIDLGTGAVLWHDPYKNLGTGATTLAAGDAVSGAVPFGKGIA